MLITDKVPYFSSCSITLLEKNKDTYCWECIFTIEKETTPYRLFINSDFLPMKNKGWVWNYFQVEYKEDATSDWLYDLSHSDTWDDHVFSQCVQLIKKHSKYRVQLLLCLSYEYNESNFSPEIYPKPPIFTIDELKKDDN
jgi:hypothetical protein